MTLILNNQGETHWAQYHLALIFALKYDPQIK